MPVRLPGRDRGSAIPSSGPNADFANRRQRTRRLSVTSHEFSTVFTFGSERERPSESSQGLVFRRSAPGEARTLCSFSQSTREWSVFSVSLGKRERKIRSHFAANARKPFPSLLDRAAFLRSRFRCRYARPETTLSNVPGTTRDAEYEKESLVVRLDSEPIPNRSSETVTMEPLRIPSSRSALTLPSSSSSPFKKQDYVTSERRLKQWRTRVGRGGGAGGGGIVATRRRRRRRAPRSSPCSRCSSPLLLRSRTRSLSRSTRRRTRSRTSRGSPRTRSWPTR